MGKKNPRQVPIPNYKLINKFGMNTSSPKSRADLNIGELIDKRASDMTATFNNKVDLLEKALPTVISSVRANIKVTNEAIATEERKHSRSDTGDGKFENNGAPIIVPGTQQLPTAEIERPVNPEASGGKYDNRGSSPLTKTKVPVTQQLPTTELEPSLNPEAPCFKSFDLTQTEIVKTISNAIKEPSASEESDQSLDTKDTTGTFECSGSTLHENLKSKINLLPNAAKENDPSSFNTEADNQEFSKLHDEQPTLSENDSLTQERLTNEIYLAIKADIDVLKHEFNTQMDEFCNYFRQLIERINDLEQEVDDLEQYSRRNALVVFGIQETKDENLITSLLKIFEFHLHIVISPSDIDRAHRIGSPSSNRQNGKPRPVIIKFTHYSPKATIFFAKKDLKKSPFVIAENLTLRRQRLLMAAKELVGPTKAWSIDGNIFALLPSNRKIKVTNLDQLEAQLNN